MDRGAWEVTVHGVAKSRTSLSWLLYETDPELLTHSTESWLPGNMPWAITPGRLARVHLTPRLLRSPLAAPQAGGGSCTCGYCYHLSKFHIYALVYCIGVFLSGLLHSV